MNKDWYKSKTIWSAVIIAGVGICQAFGVELPFEVIYSLAGAFGIYGIRDAIDNKKK